MPATVNVTAGTQNQTVFQTASLTVPKGTKQITLTYNVQTDEYPQYVLAQSIFNDVWSLRVSGGNSGKQLFGKTLQVNSQLQTPPIWQGNGTTGQIQEQVTLANLTQNSDITLTLYASAKNIGDSILPTRVSATLLSLPTLTIDSVKRNTYECANGTKGNEGFYSIPRGGQTNTCTRFFTLKVTKPETTKITRVIANLTANNSSFMTVVNAVPGASGSPVQLVDNSTLKVRVTLKDNNSSINTDPPPANSIKYRFQVIGTSSGVEVQDTKDSGNQNGLWRMPPDFSRFGGRDTGGDDWCSRGAYNWLLGNKALVKRINDISAEHSRNIGHATHQYGTDIDMFHFYTFPNGGGSSSANYQRLLENVVKASKGDVSARNLVISWINATREGLGNLATLNTVERLIYALGSSSPSGLTSGWAQSLIRTGQTTVNGKSLVFVQSTWIFSTNPKIRYRADHNDHVHITLNRKAIGDT